jgi:ribosomal protein L32
MNNYLKNKIQNLINETLEDKANEVMEKLKFNKPGSSFDYVEEGECSECSGEMREGECMECGYKSGSEVMEKLHGNQRRIDKNRNNKIDAEDFRILRSKRKETKEGKSQECMECGSPNMNEGECMECGYNKGSEVMEKLYGKQKRIDKNHNNRIDSEDFKMLRKKEDGINENVFYELTMPVNGKREKLLFTEGQFEEIIENIVLKEESKFNKGKTPAGYAEYERSVKKSKKEGDDYMKDLSEKMKDYLKDGSKGKYEMSPKHFPKGNGELGEMNKKAYVASGAIEDYIDNFTAAGLENLDYDEIHPDEDWVTDNVEGASRTGNNPEWANAVETPNNKKRNKIRKDNLLAKIKRKAYNKAPQSVVIDKSGENEGDKIMTKLESIDEKKKQKINEDFTRIMNLMTYKKNTQ